MKTRKFMKIARVLWVLLFMIVAFAPFRAKAAASFQYLTYLDAPFGDSRFRKNAADTNIGTTPIIKKDEKIVMAGWVLSTDKIDSYQVVARNQNTQKEIDVRAFNWPFEVGEFYAYSQQNRHASFNARNSGWRMLLDASTMRTGIWNFTVKAKRTSNSQYFTVAQIQLKIAPGYAVCDEWSSASSKRYSINKATVRTLTNPILAGSQDFISVNGWALHDDGVSSYSYQITNANNEVVDSGRISALFRSDLNAVRKELQIALNGSVRYAGYSGDIPIKLLDAGKYTATVIGKTNKNKDFEVSKVKFTIARNSSSTPNGPKKITLSGDAKDHLITTEYCYVEGEKFYLLFDKDLDIPGDLADNIALIMDTLEEKTGLKYATSYVYLDFMGRPRRMGETVGCYDPWENFDFGQKVPIYLIVDHDGKAWWSHSTIGYAYINRPGFYTDEICAQLGEDYSFYKGYVEYDVIAHELTHVLTERYAKLTETMSEGSADYYAVEIVRSLAKNSESFAKCAAHLGDYFETYGLDVTPQNAEALFWNDFEDESYLKYPFGRVMCEFLQKTYGDRFLKDYIGALRQNGYGYGGELYYEWPMDPEKKRAAIFKQFFGDDIFVRFAAYWQAHN